MPLSGKIPHAAERLGPWAMAAEPARPEPVRHNGRGHGSERPAYRKKQKQKQKKQTKKEYSEPCDQLSCPRQPVQPESDVSTLRGMLGMHLYVFVMKFLLH